MKRFVLVLSATLLAASPALACRGVTEFPKTAAALENSSLPTGKLDALRAKLDAAAKRHDAAHAKNDTAEMGASLVTLDEVKAETDN
jgi:hypothetical protein